jgi:Holliday junction resolvase RusA-like endonuclease
MKAVKLNLIGRPITKKNSQRIVLTKNNKRFIIQSKQYLDYEKNCLWQLKAQYKGETITDKLNLKAYYYMPDRRIPDLINLLQSTCDILEKARIIENDKNIISFDGSKIMGINKENPRTEIIIEGLGGGEK